MRCLDSFKCRRTLKVGQKSYVYFSLLVAEKSGFQPTEANGHGMGSLQSFADRMTKEAMDSMQQAALTERADAAAVVAAPTKAVEKG